MKKQFEGKTALITGGASGMGLLCGKCFAAEGAKVALVDVNGEALEKATEGMENVVRIVADVRDFNQVKDSVDKAIAELGGIDILVNMAGGNEARILNSYNDFCDQPIDVLNWGLDVNLRGPMYYCHEVSRNMRLRKTGVIINIGSITGIDGSYGDTYATAKTGVMYGLTKTMANFGAKHGFRCVCVSPGPVLTRPGMANMKTLLGRAAQPQEIVDLILFLASDKAAFITGENILIDGGRQLLRG